MRRNRRNDAERAEVTEWLREVSRRVEAQLPAVPEALVFSAVDTPLPRPD